MKVTDLQQKIVEHKNLENRILGARLSEIQAARWDYVDWQKQRLNLPDSKTEAKQDHHLVNIQKPWRAIRKLAGLDDVRIHDLRHSYASIAVSGGYSLPMIGKLLGHTQTATTQRYAHLADDPICQASDKIADTMDAIMKGNGGDNVVPLQRKTG